MTFCELILKKTTLLAGLPEFCRHAVGLGTLTPRTNRAQHNGTRRQQRRPLKIGRPRLARIAFASRNARRCFLQVVCSSSERGSCGRDSAHVAKFATHRVFADWPGLGVFA